MASLLSLPDEVIDIIGIAAGRSGGIGAWCKLTSTCRRLQRLQLPQARSGWEIPSHLSIEGVIWVLQRMRAAPWLGIDFSKLGANWAYGKPEPDVQTVNRLQEHVKVAIELCRGLDLRLLELCITVEEELLPKGLVSILQHWKQVLLWEGRHLEALTISAAAAPCPPMLGCLSKLKFLELILVWDAEPWLDQLFANLSFCYSLESLKIAYPEDMDPDIPYSDLPEVQLSSLPNLKRVELIGWLSDSGFSLPSDCELCVNVASLTAASWEDHWVAMQSHLTVLWLADMSNSVRQRWLEGFERLSRLQYLHFETLGSLALDLATLKAIPHVDLYIWGTANLTLTEGAWQSLKVHGIQGLCIEFSDVDAFVRRTERFLLMSSGLVEVSQPLCTSIREACSRQGKSCYQCGYIWQFAARPYTVRLSNCEEVMRLESLHDGKLTPSGGVHDGYAGTPEDSPLWECLYYKSLVSLEEFWPDWEPHKWVFGQ